MIQICRLGMESIQSIIAFNRLCFPTDFWQDSDWKELLEDERAIYYAMMDGERIVGNAFIYNWIGEKDFVKIMNLAVHPEYRRRGFAALLLDHVTNEMRAFNPPRFCGETRASNLGMQRAFEKCGYRLNRIEPDYYQNPNESAYKYVLKL